MGRPATIQLNSAQVDSVIAQQASGTAPITPPTTPPTSPTPPTPSLPTNAKQLVLSWQSPVRLFSSTVGFGFSDTLVIQFTTGNVSTTNDLPHIVAVEYVDPPSQRTAVLSKYPNDFGLQSFGGTVVPFATVVSSTITMVFGIGDTEGVVSQFYPRLRKNTVYFCNIRNNLAGLAGYGMSIDLIKAGNL